MKIGILGGAFDPITKGHLAIAQWLIVQTVVDQVWFLPCYHSYWGKRMAPGHDRLIMCQLAIDYGIQNRLVRDAVKVCDYEIRYQSTGHSLEIWQELMQKFNSHGLDKFYFIIGLDNALKIDSWYQPEELKRTIPFLVVPRQIGQSQSVVMDLDQTWFTQEPHIWAKDFPANWLSSTRVKWDLTNQGLSDSLVPAVLNHIKAHNCYVMAQESEPSNESDD